MKTIQLNLKLASIVVFSLILVGSNSSLSRAQTSSESAATASGTTEQFLQRQRLLADIEQTKQELLAQLEDYNQVEKKYRIALSQYQSHQTLKSIREAVDTARNAMLSRNEVLITYLKLLKFKLIETEGIEVTHKKKALNQLEQMLVRLGQFEARIEPVEDRIKLNELATEFTQLGTEVKETSYYSLCLLSLGKLQGVYDQATVLEEKIDNELSESSQLDQAANDQALKETERLITAINPLLRDVWTDIDQVKTDRATYETQYRSMFDDLNPVYAKLSQLVSYLEELLKL